MTPGERIDLEYDIQTKDGADLSFVFIHDSERENRGFVVDRLEAFTGDERVGYIKAMYVGSDRVGHFYPSVLNYITQIGGSSVLPWNNATIDPAKASPTEFAKIVDGLHSYSFVRSRPEEPITNYKDLKKWIAQEAKINRKLQNATKDFQSFLARTVDRPIVDFVNTYFNEHNGVKIDNQGRGIGTALYQVMAIELDKRGMTLRSSTLQSPKAQRIWNTFQAKGWTKMDGDRLALDPTKFELCLKSQFTKSL